MDVDISDILADISRPQQYQSSSSLLPLPSHSSASQHQYDPQTAYTDHILLTRAWVAERGTPSLFPYPTALITRIMDRIRAQIAHIEDLTSGIYDTSGGVGATNVPTNLNLTLSILQTDLSRTQFLVRSYLRQRLAKVTKFAGYYTKQHLQQSQSQDNDTKTDPLLSPQELTFLTHHNQVLHNYYNSSFLGSLPPALRRLDDNSGGIARMDEGPDGKEGIMVRCLVGSWGNEGDVVVNAEEDTERDEERVTVELRVERGGILVARWRDVRSGVVGGQLEVL